MASWLLSRVLYKSLDDEHATAEVVEYPSSDVGGPSPHHLQAEPEALRDFLQDPRAMGSLEKLLSESYKFIRMADDLHDISEVLSQMRWCLLFIVATGYFLLAIYLCVLCKRRNRRTQQRRRNWEYQLENQRDYNANADHNGGEQLTQTRTDSEPNRYMRNHRSGPNAAPSTRHDTQFMRHGHMNHQQTTRLMTDADGAAVKHQLPHITTTEPPAEEKGAKVPRLVKDSE